MCMELCGSWKRRLPKRRGTIYCAHHRIQFQGRDKSTLGEIIRYFKAKTAFQIQNSNPSPKIWQRNYYERIIRTEKELRQTRQYILDNPKNWDNDPENMG